MWHHMLHYIYLTVNDDKMCPYIYKATASSFPVSPPSLGLKKTYAVGLININNQFFTCAPEYASVQLSLLC